MRVIVTNQMGNLDSDTEVYGPFKDTFEAFDALMKQVEQELKRIGLDFKTTENEGIEFEVENEYTIDGEFAQILAPESDRVWQIVDLQNPTKFNKTN